MLKWGNGYICGRMYEVGVMIIHLDDEDVFFLVYIFAFEEQFLIPNDTSCI